MNYKKSLLSLVTIMALSNSAVADTSTKYLPLTSPTVDGMWNLFGVVGFSNGVPTTGTTVVSTNFTTDFTELVDTVADDALATSGLASGGGDLVAIQGLSEVGFTDLSIGIDISSYTYDPTEAVRSVYVKLGTEVPAMKLDYKVSLEGAVVEVLVNGSTFYHFTINQTNTWSNAAVAASGKSVATTGGGTTADKTAITDVLDYDFDNNPVDPSRYDSSVHQDTIAANLGLTHFYHYNAINSQWDVWNKYFSSLGQDFTTLTAGKAYWGRLDAVEKDGENNAIKTNTGTAGLILGEASGDPEADIYSGKLTAGWNMLAFNDTKPDIRYSATGLVISGIDVADRLQITDSSGLHSIPEYTFAAAVAATDMATHAQTLNAQIESLKLRGALPDSLNIKVFATGTPGEVVVISDNKFYVDSAAGATIAVTTLTGGDVYVDGVKDTIDGAAPATSLQGLATTATAVESVYGEYSMLLEVLTGAGTAAELDNTAADNGANVSAKILFGQAGVDGTARALHTDVGTADTAPSLTTAKDSIDADPVFNGTNATGQAVAIDIDFDGTADMLIAAADEPFYVKDNTFTRVFTYDITQTAALPLTIQGDATVEVTPDATPTLTEIVDLINDEADASAETGVYAAEDGTKLVLVNTTNDTFDLKDAANATVDYLAETTSSDDIAKGAIKGVYSLSDIARKSVNQVTSTIATITTAANGAWINDDFVATDTYTLTINGAAQAPVALDGIAGITTIIDTYDELILLLDKIVADINAYAVANDLHMYASHGFAIPEGSLGTDFVAAATAITVDLTVSGVDVDDTAALTLAFTDDDAAAGDVATVAAEAITGKNDITLGTGDLVADLKTNPIYTPNYAAYGPLYTLNEAGYDVRAVLKATTDMDAATEVIEWDGIDITRLENEWFANNEFNLFNVNSSMGYWVYLEEAQASGIVIGTPTFTPTYTYYFGNDASNTTTNIINGGQLEVTVQNLGESAASSVVAIVGGEDVPLKRAAVGSDQYTADISKYALQTFGPKSPDDISVTIRAVNGKGEAKLDGAIGIDYAKPAKPVVDSTTATGISITSADATKLHVFKGYIPEVNTADDVNISRAVAGAVELNLCGASTFGDVSGFRIVAADGDGEIGSSNLSNALDYTYAGTLKGAHVLTNTGGETGASVGTLYGTACEATAATTDDGVRLTTLVASEVARMSFEPIDGQAFGQGFGVVDAQFQVSGGDEVVLIQATEAYVGETFFVEYGGALYSQTFPTAAAGAASISGAPIVLTPVSATNTSLLP